MAADRVVVSDLGGTFFCELSRKNLQTKQVKSKIQDQKLATGAAQAAPRAKAAKVYF